LETIEEEGQKIREAKLRAHENQLKQMKKTGIANAEEEFGDLLAQYGDQVASVDEEMKTWRKDQLSSLEERLRQRRNKRHQELADGKVENE